MFTFPHISYDVAVIMSFMSLVWTGLYFLSSLSKSNPAPRAQSARFSWSVPRIAGQDECGVWDENVGPSQVVFLESIGAAL